YQASNTKPAVIEATGAVADMTEIELAIVFAVASNPRARAIVAAEVVAIVPRRWSHRPRPIGFGLLFCSQPAGSAGITLVLRAPVIAAWVVKVFLVTAVDIDHRTSGCRPVTPLTGYSAIQASTRTKNPEPAPGPAGTRT